MANEKENAKTADVSGMMDAAAGLVSKDKLDKVAKPAEQPQNQQASVKQPEVKESVNSPVVIKSPLGDQVFGGTPIADIKLKSFEDVAKFAKDFTGMELKDVQDFVSVFTKVKELTQKAEDVNKLQTIVDTYKSTLNNLPSEVSLIVNAAMNGQDHMPIIRKLQQKDAFDFTKPFESHEPVEVINRYTSKQYTKETLDALAPEAQEALMDVARLRYKTDQDDYSNIQVNTKKTIEDRQNKFQASVESSIAQMLANNPKMGKEAVERIRQIMAYGLGDTLFSKDRTYLPDAAEKIAYLEFGKQIVNDQQQTIGDLVAKIRAEAEGKTTEKILMRSDKPDLKGGGKIGDKNALQAIVDKETGFLKAK